MHTWGNILKEVTASIKPGQPPNLDGIRRKYLAELRKHTGRPVILYSSRFTLPGQQVSPDLLSINDEDMEGFMEVMHGLKSRQLDLILHSPGGSLEAAEAIVNYLRSKFTDIRVIVPHLALSAAAMISCSANKVLMGKHSFLGPTDPQFVLNTTMGLRAVSAEAVLDQFQMAQAQCQDPAQLGAWIPMLNQYGPDLIVKCQNACDMSKSLVKGWLESYMLKGSKDATKKAEKIAQWLSTHKNFKTHGRHIPRRELQRKGLVIEHLEKDKVLQDLVLAVFHATTITFTNSPVVKIIENYEGAAFIKSMGMPAQMPQIQIPFAPGQPGQPGMPPGIQFKLPPGMMIPMPGAPQPVPQPQPPVPTPKPPATPPSPPAAQPALPKTPP